jgi:hypothetical protein
LIVGSAILSCHSSFVLCLICFPAFEFCCFLIESGAKEKNWLLLLQFYYAIAVVFVGLFAIVLDLSAMAYDNELYDFS